MRSLFPLALAAVLHAASAQSLPDLLSRVSEEAAVFRNAAPQIVSEETLTQRALKPVRVRPHLGAAAAKPAPPSFETREIVSEYSFGAFTDAPESLHEFREIVSVDGRRVSSSQSARHSLALGLTSRNDRARKRMLEKFQKHGLVTAVTDFGPLLLLFTRRQMANYSFELGPRARIGADLAQIITYRQTAGPARMLVFQGRQALHQPIEGRIYVRLPDGLPLRITITSSRTEGSHTYRDEASVDYVLSPQGFLAPASVMHHGYADDKEMVEDSFRYTPFRKFGADAEIKFDALPGPAK